MARKELSAEEIEARMSDIKDWQIEGVNLKKRFEFKNFTDALAFVNKAGEIADEMDHHPDVILGWGYAEFEITTHDTGALTQNDFDLAKKIEEI